MLLLYRTDSLDFAHALHARLLDEGIASNVTGQMLHSLRPRHFGLDLLSIWIEDEKDLAPARQVLRDELGDGPSRPATPSNKALVGFISAAIGAAVAFALLLSLR